MLDRLCTTFFLTVVILHLATSWASAETIYIRDGNLIKARIASADDKSIGLEENDLWQRIDKEKRDLIKKDSNNLQSDNTPPLMNTLPNHVTQTNEPITPAVNRENQSKDFAISETILKIALDMNSSLDWNGTVKGYYFPFSGTGSYDTGYGISLSAEEILNTTVNLGLGMGLSYQMPREVTSRGYSLGKFNFIPVYALIRLRTTPDNNVYLYSTGQLGYNLLEGNDDFTGPTGKLSGGSYYGLGVGLVYDKLQFELLYHVHHGSVRDSATVLTLMNGNFTQTNYNMDITYSLISFTVGYIF